VLVEKLFNAASDPNSTEKINDNKQSMYKDPGEEPEVEIYKPATAKESSAL
jgi:hypothetical protein